MKISIILVTKNAGKQFAELLSKLHQQEPKPLEIIVIDSGSTDGTVEIASKNGCKIHIIAPEEFHHGKTRNYGASLALGDCVVFLSQDVAPVSNSLLHKLILPLADDRIAAVYGRQIAYPDADPIEKFFYLHFYANAGTIRLTNADCENKNIFYVKYAFTSDACAALRKSVWEQFKFSETVVMAEDKQWALDVLTAGYTLIYEPTAEVFHSHSYPLGKTFKRRFDDGMAQKQICGSSRGVGALGRKYFFEQFTYLFKYHKRSLPKAFTYTIIGTTGFFLGNHYHWFPKSIRKKLSQHSK